MLIIPALSEAAASAATNAGGPQTRKRKAATDMDLNPQEHEYWGTMDAKTKAKIQSESKALCGPVQLQMPTRFKVLLSDKDAKTKSVILRKLSQIERMHECSGEYHKINNWVENACRLPIGRYLPMAVDMNSRADQIYMYLQKVRRDMDDTVYGHTDAKDQIMRIMAQWVANPGSNGNCIGIQGPMGCGKTSLVKDGVCRALGLPFNMIALGGAGDGSFLEGHGFTYEGSTYGKIADSLMKSECMNPVIFFDELDKVSGTRHGEDIVGILTHLTDSSQNEHFSDRYFSELELDLSRALIVFSYNDESMINPILKDRMITIHAKGYSRQEKIVIARDYLIPNILKQFGLSVADIDIPQTAIERIIARVTTEEGVRNLKRGIENVVSWLNMHRFIPVKPKEHVLTFPITVTEEIVDKYVKRDANVNGMTPEVHHMMYI